MNKKRYIPLVAIGALILSLIVVFPAFGADVVSFIDPDDIANENDGTLDDETPDEQMYGMQDGIVGLFLEDDGLDVPVRRVLIPAMGDAEQIGGDIGTRSRTSTDTVVLAEIASIDSESMTKVEAHSDVIMAKSGVLSKNDYVMLGNHNVRQVTKVVAPEAVTASTGPMWNVQIPYSDDGPTGGSSVRVNQDPEAATPADRPDANDIAIPTTTLDFGTALGGASNISVTRTITMDPDNAGGIPDTLTLTGSTTDIFAAAVATTPLTEGTDATGKLVLTPGGSVDSFDTGAVGTYTVTITATHPGTDTAATATSDDTVRTAILTINIIGKAMDEVTLDKPFAMDEEDLTVYLVDGAAMEAVSSVNWSDDYGLYAMAIRLDNSGTDTDNVDVWSGQLSYAKKTVARSRIATRGAPEAATDRGNLQHRLTGSEGGARVDDDDALVVSFDDAGNTDPADDVTGTLFVSTRTSPTEILFDNDNDPTNAPALDTTSTAEYYVVAWFEERNHTGGAVSVRSQAYQTSTTLVLQETEVASGEFALRIKAGAFGTATPESGEMRTEWEEADPSYTDSDDNPLPVLPVNPRDVITLAGADSTTTLLVESAGPTFTGLSPAHNTAGSDSRPEVSAQVIDSDSELDKKNIDILFWIDEVGATSRGRIVNPNTDGDVDAISGGFEVRGELAGADAPENDATISWWIRATDAAGNTSYSDRVVTNDDGTADACNISTKVDAAALAAEFADTKTCDPYVVRVDSTPPKLLRAETGRHWNSALQTGDSKDKTEYRVTKANKSSVLVVFDSHLDATTVSTADFEVSGSTPADTSVYNVKVRDDMFAMKVDPMDATKMIEDDTTGDGNSAIEGDNVQDVGEPRGYVFLRLSSDLKASAEPKVELVGEVLDLAGNEQDTGVDNDALDRIAPTLTVTIDEGTRPVTMDKVNLTISSDENVGTPTVTFHNVMQKTVDDETTQTIGAVNNGTVKFVSATEYTAVVSAGNTSDGLYSIYVKATDAAGGNIGMTGDVTADVDVSDDTKAILFEHDENIGDPDIDPGKDGVQDEFETDDMNGYISIGFSAEANEYDMEMMGTGANAKRVGDDLDTHHGITIVSATLNGDDISGALQSNVAGNVFLYRAPDGLAVGEHELAIIAMDAAGNKHAVAKEATITITERKPFSLKLNPGWNLVSIPGEPADPDINVVIPADRTDITSVLAYDPSVPGLWLSASRGADGMFSGTLKNITATRGYWVETNTFSPLPVMIPKQSPGLARVLPTIPVAKGWNMVPVLDVDGNFMLEDGNDDRKDSDKLPTMMTDDGTRGYLDGLPEDTRVYTFNTITNRWDLVSEVQIGKGYWVYVSKAGIIVP